MLHQAVGEPEQGTADQRRPDQTAAKRARSGQPRQRRGGECHETDDADLGDDQRAERDGDCHAGKADDGRPGAERCRAVVAEVEQA